MEKVKDNQPDMQVGGVTALQALTAVQEDYAAGKIKITRTMSFKGKGSVLLVAKQGHIFYRIKYIRKMDDGHKVSMYDGAFDMYTSKEDVLKATGELIPFLLKQLATQF